jgi:hypothetical protein
MSNYETASYGPGEIAALPPTIGMTSRAPTIGSTAPGRPIRKTYGMGQEATTTPAPTTGSSTMPTWLVPVGIGVAIGGFLALFMGKMGK